MPYPEGKHIAVATPDDAQAWSWVSQLGDSGSSTCAGTAARESGPPSFGPQTPGSSDTLSIQPIRSHTRTKRLPNDKRISATRGRQITKRLKQSSAIRSLQQQIECVSRRLDAKCFEVSKIQIEVNNPRAELRERPYYSEIYPQPGRYVAIEEADVVYTTPGGGGVYWREATKESCPEAGAGCVWGKTVPTFNT